MNCVRKDNMKMSGVSWLTHCTLRTQNQSMKGICYKDETSQFLRRQKANSYTALLFHSSKRKYFKNIPNIMIENKGKFQAIQLKAFYHNWLTKAFGGTFCGILSGGLISTC